MIKILVTGGAGNVGSALVKKLIQDKNTFVLIVDNLITGKLENLPNKNYNNWKYFNFDVNNLNEVKNNLECFKVDFIFHFAALVGVKRTIDNPISVLKDIHGFDNILNFAVEFNVKKIFFSSSSEVYGEPVEIPQNEITTPLNSRLPYSVVKNLGEVYLRSFYKCYNLDYTIFRFFNTYGPSQSDDFVIMKFLKKAINNEPITIFGEGNQTRTFCYIDDNIDTIYTIYKNNLLTNSIINIGNNVEMSILNVAKLIIDITNSKSEIIHLAPLEEGDMTRRKPDNTIMKNILNRELIDLKTGIKNIIISNFSNNEN